MENKDKRQPSLMRPVTPDEFDLIKNNYESKYGKISSGYYLVANITHKGKIRVAHYEDKDWGFDVKQREVIFESCILKELEK